MYWRLAIQTRLSPVEAEEALRRIVGPKQFILNPPVLDPRPFRGTVSNATFKFQRFITGRNSFLPVISGRIEQGEGGAVVRTTMHVNPVVILFMTIWMGAAVTGFWHLLQQALANGGGLRDVAVASLMPVFGVALIAIGYIPEVRKAARLIRDAVRLN